MLLAAGVALASGVAGGILLLRWIGRPVDADPRRRACARRRRGGRAPLLEPPGEATGRGLARAAIAFERVGAALALERSRLAGKVAELERANTELVSARESLLRSERLATLGRLASGIAHEVGNPLGAITGYVELARGRLRAEDPAAVRHRGTAEVDDFLARIGAEASRIDAIVRDLLDFARSAPPALGPVDVGAAVDAAVRLARVQARFRDVEVEIEVGGGGCGSSRTSGGSPRCS